MADELATDDFQQALSAAPPEFHEAMREQVAAAAAMVPPVMELTQEQQIAAYREQHEAEVAKTMPPRTKDAPIQGA